MLGVSVRALISENNAWRPEDKQLRNKHSYLDFRKALTQTLLLERRPLLTDFTGYSEPSEEQE